jgi:hypothetical protein
MAPRTIRSPADGIPARPTADPGITAAAPTAAADRASMARRESLQFFMAE